MALDNTSRLPSRTILFAPGAAAGVLSWFGQVLRAVATRRQLAQLDDRSLQDIGISRTGALAEASRAPWDLRPRR